MGLSKIRMPGTNVCKITLYRVYIFNTWGAGILMRSGVE